MTEKQNIETENGTRKTIGTGKGTEDFYESIDTDRNLVNSIRRMTEASAETSEGDERFTYVVTEADGKTTAKQILRRRLGFSHRLISRVKQGGTVSRNGVVVRLFADVIPGDEISVVLPEEKSHFTPQDIPIDIAYEDRDLMVINKQPWVVVHPTRNHQNDTIANGLTKLMDDRGKIFKIRFVNRLDRDTSGLLIVAKNSHAQDVLTQEMKLDHLEKKYIAVVHGILDEDEGTIDLPIGRKPDQEQTDVKRYVTETGYPSVTHYRVLRRFGSGEGIYEGGFTEVELRLETGRTHQIRVHMTHIGHPLVGDPQYGASEPELLDRQALHAAHLGMKQPVSGEQLEIDAALPEDIDILLKKLEKNCPKA
ncbi:MAG: RluA family pseudouridine synthase [Clostridia bacterium]|nr:RluA family pseudouridine synthase [Clostridia bacterium]